MLKIFNNLNAEINKFERIFNKNSLTTKQEANKFIEFNKLITKLEKVQEKDLKKINIHVGAKKTRKNVTFSKALGMIDRLESQINKVKNELAKVEKQIEDRELAKQKTPQVLRQNPTSTIAKPNNKKSKPLESRDTQLTNKKNKLAADLREYEKYRGRIDMIRMKWNHCVNHDQKRAQNNWKNFLDGTRIVVEANKTSNPIPNNLRVAAVKFRFNEALTNDARGKLLIPKDNRGTSHKLWHGSKRWFNAIGMNFRRVIDNVSTREQYLTPKKNAQNVYEYPLDSLPWNQPRATPSTGLNIFIHGLRGTPTHWKRYTEQLKREHPDMDTIAPNVPLKGNCSLKEAAAPILVIIEDYLRKHPGAPINIIGTSNGGRIAMYLESHINPDLLRGSKITVTSIAGVHYGTKVVTNLKKNGLIKVAGLHKHIETEFEWGSKRAQKELNRWRERQVVWEERGIKVNHLFVATTEDELVTSIAASLPAKPANIQSADIKYDQIIYHGENHTSIVERARKEVMQSIFS